MPGGHSIRKRWGRGHKETAGVAHLRIVHVGHGELMRVTWVGGEYGDGENSEVWGGEGWRASGPFKRLIEGVCLDFERGGRAFATRPGAVRRAVGVRVGPLLLDRFTLTSSTLTSSLTRLR
jgi:hypothetical protein